MIDYGKAYRDVRKRYPIPCPKECDLDEPCVECKHCAKWVAIDFCRWREYKKIKKQVASDTIAYKHAQEGWLRWIDKMGY